MNCNNNFNLGLNSNSCNDGLRHIEQIALNKAGIDCLNGRVSRAESDIKERYTKAELDRILACKMDKCGCGRPHHHGNGKPSICDYYTKEELDQLLAEIACKCDTYSKEELDGLLDKIACACDCYSKEEVDALLENKVNIEEPIWYDLPLENGQRPIWITPQYMKDQFGYTHLRGYVGGVSDKDGMVIDEPFAILPIGFRPPITTYRIACGLSSPDGGGGKLWVNPTGISIDADGEITRHSAFSHEEIDEKTYLRIDGVSFPTEQ